MQPSCTMLKVDTEPLSLNIIFFYATKTLLYLILLVYCGAPFTLGHTERVIPHWGGYFLFLLALITSNCPLTLLTFKISQVSGSASIEMNGALDTSKLLLWTPTCSDRWSFLLVTLISWFKGPPSTGRTARGLLYFLR